MCKNSDFELHITLYMDKSLTLLFSLIVASIYIIFSLFWKLSIATSFTFTGQFYIR